MTPPPPHHYPTSSSLPPRPYNAHAAHIKDTAVITVLQDCWPSWGLNASSAPRQTSASSDHEAFLSQTYTGQQSVQGTTDSHSHTNNGITKHFQNDHCTSNTATNIGRNLSEKTVEIGNATSQMNSNLIKSPGLNSSLRSTCTVLITQPSWLATTLKAPSGGDVTLTTSCILSMSGKDLSLLIKIIGLTDLRIEKSSVWFLLMMPTQTIDSTKCTATTDTCTSYHNCNISNHFKRRRASNSTNKTSQKPANDQHTLGAKLTSLISASKASPARFQSKLTTNMAYTDLTCYV